MKNFIDARIGDHPQIEPFLGNWSPSHETQILIDTTKLEPCFATRKAFLRNKPTHWIDDKGYEHRNIRIPYGAMTTSPTFPDREVVGPITTHWQYIGTTGWDWLAKKSIWLGYDFDSITNHTEGLDNETLNEVLNRARELPYVVVRTSKSGLGIHLFVEPRTQLTIRTHTEHSQLAKHLLSRMSEDCGFDFEDVSDVGGGNLWHWERGLNNDGIRIIH